MSTQPSPGPLPHLTEPLFWIRSDLRRTAHLLDDLKFEEAAEVLEEAVVQLGELHLVLRELAVTGPVGLARLDAALRGTSAVVTGPLRYGSAGARSSPPAAPPQGALPLEETLPEF